MFTRVYEETKYPSGIAAPSNFSTPCARLEPKKRLKYSNFVFPVEGQGRGDDQRRDAGRLVLSAHIIRCFLLVFHKLPFCHCLRYDGPNSPHIKQAQGVLMQSGDGEGWRVVVNRLQGWSPSAPMPQGNKSPPLCRDIHA